MDLSKVSTEGLKAIQEKRWKDVPTPDLQEYQSQQQHQVQAQQQAQNPQVTPDSADKAASPSQQTMSPEQMVHNQVSKLSKISPQGQQMLESSLKQVETPTGVSQLGTTLLPGASSAASAGLGIAGKLGMSGLLGGSTAVGSQDPDQAPIDKLSSFLKGGALGAGVQAAGGVAGKAGDYLMQRAVGLRKYLPGIGTSLADQGVVGTKNMMENQVSDKLSAEEEKLQGLVKGLQGTVNSKEIASAVSNKAEQFTLPSTGQPSPFSKAELQKVRSTADELSKMGDLSAPDLLALKRQGDYQGYTASGNPASATEASLGRAGADAARQELKKMSPEVADSLFKEQALVKAKAPLSSPDRIHQGNISSMIFGKVPGQSLLESVGGQAGVKSGQTLSDPRTQRAVSQGLFGD